MKVYQVLIAGLISSLIAINVAIFKLVTMWLDPTFVQGLQLSHSADSVGIPIFGAIIFGTFATSITIGFYVAWLIALTIKRLLRTTISLKSASLQPRFGRVGKILVIIFTLGWAILLYCPPFYTYVNPFYIVSDTLACLAAIASAYFICLLIAALAPARHTRP